MSDILVITAKGYSSRFRGNKALATWRGGPVLGHVIRAAKAVHLPTRLVVCTEDSETAAYADAKGCEVCWADEAATKGTMRYKLAHVARTLPGIHDEDNIVGIPADGPKIRPETIDHAFELCGAGMPVMSVIPPPIHPYYALRRAPDSGPGWAFMAPWDVLDSGAFPEVVYSGGGVVGGKRRLFMAFGPSLTMPFNVVPLTDPDEELFCIHTPEDLL